MFSMLSGNLRISCQPVTQRRCGMTRLELVVLAIIAFLALLILGPWLLRQRAAARRNVCQSHQFAIARAHLLRTTDTRHLVGFRNPENLRLVAAEDLDSAVGWVEPIMIYIHGLRSRTNQLSGRGTELEELFALRGDGDFPAGEYYTKLRSSESRVVPKIYELNCPDQGKIDYRNHPDASTTVVNSGLPDVIHADFPRDWRANGPFMDLTDDDPDAFPVSLEFIEDRDGLSNTLMLTENLDAGGWLSDSEADNAFVWRDFPDGKRGDSLLAINRQPGASKQTIDRGDPYLFARPSSFHSGGVNVVFCDGSTRFLSQDMDYVVFALMMSCDDENARLAGSEKPVSDYYRRNDQGGQ